jgi:2-aminoethylphosphonate-pyruvate transaminase
VAFDAALEQFVAQGGQPGRLARYTDNCAALVSGMGALGFRPFLDKLIQAPIIVTFHAPADERYDFKTFYANVRDRGFILYPGKLTQVETFRVGCIGAIGPEEMRQAVHAIADALAQMGIRNVAPAAQPAIRAA